jgi:hypothetical protein
MKKNNRNGCPAFARAVCVAAALLLLATTLNLQAQYNYTTLVFPGAEDTEACGISRNDIVGDYNNSSGDEYGFLYNGSTYTTLSIPGATGTSAQGISGTSIVGYYYYSYVDSNSPVSLALLMDSLAGETAGGCWRE